MFVAAVEASTTLASVAVAELDERQELTHVDYVEEIIQPSRRHPVPLLSLLRAALKRAGRVQGELRGIAVGTGPGVTDLAHVWAQAERLGEILWAPVVPVSSLAALAHSTLGAVPHGSLLLTATSLHEPLYAGVYEHLENGDVKTHFETGASSATEILQRLDVLCASRAGATPNRAGALWGASNSTTDTVFVGGQGAELLRSVRPSLEPLRGHEGLTLPDAPHAVDVLAAAAPLLAARLTRHVPAAASFRLEVAR